MMPCDVLTTTIERSVRTRRHAGTCHWIEPCGRSRRFRRCGGAKGQRGRRLMVHERDVEAFDADGQRDSLTL